MFYVFIYMKTIWTLEVSTTCLTDRSSLRPDRVGGSRTELNKQTFRRPTSRTFPSPSYDQGGVGGDNDGVITLHVDVCTQMS